MILASLALLQLALLTWWALSDESPFAALKLCVAFAAWALTTVSGFHWWWNSCQGSLRWDGLQWEWLQPTGRVVLLEPPQVRLDFQSILLMQARLFGSSRSIHLWLARRADPLHWRALRRAVYSRAVGEQLSTR